MFFNNNNLIENYIINIRIRLKNFKRIKALIENQTLRILSLNNKLEFMN